MTARLWLSAGGGALAAGCWRLGLQLYEDGAAGQHWGPKEAATEIW